MHFLWQSFPTPGFIDPIVSENCMQDRNKDADAENGLEDTGRGKGKLGRSERVAWTYKYYQM